MNVHGGTLESRMSKAVNLTGGVDRAALPPSDPGGLFPLIQVAKLLSGPFFQGTCSLTSLCCGNFSGDGQCCHSLLTRRRSCVSFCLKGHYRYFPAPTQALLPWTSSVMRLCALTLSPFFLVCRCSPCSWPLYSDITVGLAAFLPSLENYHITNNDHDPLGEMISMVTLSRFSLPQDAIFQCWVKDCGLQIVLTSPGMPQLSY